MLKTWGLLIAAVALMAACAEIKVSRLTSDKDYVEGIRFYRPAPYLLVTEDAKGALQVSLIYLPKTKEEYVIQFKSGLGSADMKFKLDGGWNLTDFGETRDSKIPELVTSLATAFTGALKSEPGGPSKPAPGLYALIFDPNTGLVSEIRLVYKF
ncbi:MAG: hypothetical protein ABR951_12055 [Candidatus Aminicenantales bacterium]|jgi:hypothetical protein